MLPKEFIQNVLIHELKDIVDRHPYLSFALMSIGIEFLGKCELTEHQDWDKIKPDKAFNKGIELLSKEDALYNSLDLKNELRNGFAHTLSPKSKIALSEVRHGAIHFSKNQKDRTILVAEIFYRDFVRVCQKIILNEYSANDKMSKPFLNIGS